MTVLVGACVGQSGSWERIAAPSVARFGPGEASTRRDQRSIAEAYNSLADEAVARGATGLVLLHDDVELTAPLSEEFFGLLADDAVAVIGAVGALDPAGMSWWTGEPAGRRGAATDSFNSHVFSRGTQDVDVVDGFVMGLTSWALRNLRFDESLPAFHGYDADLCAQARAAGRRVVVTAIDVVHHNRRGIGDLDAYFAAEFAWRLKWQPASEFTRLGWRVRRDLHRLRGRLRPRDLEVSTPLSGAASA